MSIVLAFVAMQVQGVVQGLASSGVRQKRDNREIRSPRGPAIDENKMRLKSKEKHARLVLERALVLEQAIIAAARARAEAIEQCARVADQFIDLTGRSIAAAIRALKDKP